jgi:hypothetical protein
MKLPSDPGRRRSGRGRDRSGFDVLVTFRLDQPMQVAEDGLADDGVGGFRRLDQGADESLAASATEMRS